MNWSMIRGLNREYLRAEQWMVLAMSIATLVGGPWVFRGLMQLQGLTIEDQTFRPLEIHFPFLLISLMAWIAVVSLPFALWRPRVYALPVTTRLLVTWQMIVALATVLVAAPLTIWLYWLVFDLELPVLGPVLFQVMGTAIAICMTWHLLVPSEGAGTKYRKAVLRSTGVALVVAVVFVVWINSHYSRSGTIGQDVLTWKAVTAPEVAAMVAVVGLAWWLSLGAATRHRHGDHVDGPVTERVSIADSSQHRSRPRQVLRGARQALSWLLWQQGRLPGAVLSIGCGFILIAAYIAATKDFTTSDVVRSSLLFLTVFPAIGGVAIGTLLWIGASGKECHEMQPFVGTAPVSDAVLSRCCLQNTLRMATLFWGLLVAASCVFVAIAVWRVGPERLAVDLHRHWIIRQLGLLGIPLFLLWSYAATWTWCSLSAALVWTGRNWLIVLFVLLLCGGIGTASFVAGFHPSSDSGWSQSRYTLENAAMCVLAALCWCGTLLAFVMARRRHLIESRAVWLSAALACCQMIIVAGYLYRTGIPGAMRNPAIVAFWIGAIACTVVPLAAGPLAISWNRHR